MRPRYLERELYSPALADLCLDLDRYARTSDAGTVEHFVHAVDHGLLEPCLYFLGLILVALDQDLVVDAGYARLTLFGARQLLLCFCYRSIHIGHIFLVLFPYESFVLLQSLNVFG